MGLGFLDFFSDFLGVSWRWWLKKGFWTCLTTEIGLWTWLKKSQRPISGNVFVVVGGNVLQVYNIH